MTEAESSAMALSIQQRAAEFLVRRRDHSAWTNGDESDLQSWLSESMAHRVAFWRLESVWDRADRLSALRPLAQSKSARTARPRGRKPLFLLVAASIAGVAAIGLSASLWFAKPQGATYSTPIGGRETIRLADGTMIDLNTDTVIRIHLTKARRSVELVKGEALFQVHHDVARPFVLTAAHHRVIDLGTKFLAREDGANLKVVLIEGSAKLEPGSASKSEPAVLTPGDEALATADTLTVTRKSARQLDNELGWQRGVLVFQQATLFEVADEYNRYNTRKIVIGDVKAGARVITATLPTGDVAGFARMARNFLGLHVEEHESEIVISH